MALLIASVSFDLRGRGCAREEQLRYELQAQDCGPPVPEANEISGLAYLLRWPLDARNIGRRGSRLSSHSPTRDRRSVGDFLWFRGAPQAGDPTREPCGACRMRGWGGCGNTCPGPRRSVLKRRRRHPPVSRLRQKKVTDLCDRSGRNCCIIGTARPGPVGLRPTRWAGHGPTSASSPEKGIAAMPRTASIAAPLLPLPQ